MDVANNLLLLLDGKSSTEEVHCDYTLAEQLAEFGNRCFSIFLLNSSLFALTAPEKVDSQLAQFKPICKKTVCYIVAAVVFNDKGDCLMMQEAKSSCAGTWYLPAGRVEPGEDLINAVRREVYEETGLKFEPLTLIMVENAEGYWYRFVFTGSIIGGKLKTTAEADEESLQAAWVPEVEQLNLRSRDIIPLVTKAKSYWKETKTYHSPILPALRAHNKLLLRVIVLIKKQENNRLYVLVCEKHSLHLPLCEINPTRSIHASIKRFVQAMFRSRIPTHKPLGLVSVEHDPRSQNTNDMDGICLTLLISCKEAMEQAVPSAGFRWLELNTDLESKLLNRVHQNKSIVLRVIH
ncbi:nudix hydrolase-like protein [Dinothrombium tinctorium]|uniref:Nudix hydrolase-like protein n=1 Tax=Dinothrombium tinctorium TaxID=1965070 RepID=A0A3S3NZE0_9ACAR|nr:nudix hydrolase-like protein [Dinothrombium tinctorium]